MDCRGQGWHHHIAYHPSHVIALIRFWDEVMFWTFKTVKGRESLLPCPRLFLHCWHMALRDLAGWKKVRSGKALINRIAKGIMGIILDIPMICRNTVIWCDKWSFDVNVSQTKWCKWSLGCQGGAWSFTILFQLSFKLCWLLLKNCLACNCLESKESWLGCAEAVFCLLLCHTKVEMKLARRPLDETPQRSSNYDVMGCKRVPKVCAVQFGSIQSDCVKLNAIAVLRLSPSRRLPREKDAPMLRQHCVLILLLVIEQSSLVAVPFAGTLDWKLNG